MTLFWHRTGPKISYAKGVLSIEDLNPQIEMHWLMTRWQLFMFCLRGLGAALWGEEDLPAAYRTRR